MARKLILEIVADPRQAQRGFNQASRSARGFERDLGRASRGALAGSGVFRSLGRSLAFASGGFLAFATVGGFLRKSIDAAKDAQVTQRQLAAQFRASGKDLGDYQQAIDRTTNRLSLLAGFQNDELKAAFTTIFRTTGNVNKALRDTALAADLARAKHKDLATAALIVAKTEAGNVTLLRRSGLQITKNARAEQALAQARVQLAGQARAGTTAQERFGAVLHNTEEIIGTALLPTLNRYLTSLAKWLTRMNESGKLQRDVATATDTLADAIKGVKAVLSPLVEGFRTLANVTGGVKQAIELLGTAFLVLKARAAAIRFGFLATQIGGVGTAAGGARGKVAGLGAALRGLPETIAVTLAIDEIITQRQADKAIGGFEDRTGAKRFLGGGKPGDRVRAPDGSPAVLREINGQLFAVPIRQPNPLARSPFGASVFGRTGANLPANVRGVGVSPFTLTPAQQRAIALSGTPTLDALKAQRDFDKAQIAALLRRKAAGTIGAKNFMKAMISFRNDLAQQESAISTIAADQARKIADDARKAREKAKAAATAARKALERSGENASIFLESITRGLKLGVDVKGLQAAAKKAAAKTSQFTVPAALQIAEARASALGLDPATNAATRRLLERIRSVAFKAIRSGTLGLQGVLDAYSTIGSINDQLKRQSGRIIGKFKHVDPNKLLAGLDLTAAQRRALAPAVAQIGFAGRVPGARSQAFARGDVVVHTHVNLDGREIAQNTTRHQRKDSQRRAVSRRGPYAGRH